LEYIMYTRRPKDDPTGLLGCKRGRCIADCAIFFL
jgi:hypothetical protein